MDTITALSALLFFCAVLIHAALIVLETALTTSRRSKLEIFAKEGSNSAQKAVMLLLKEDEILRTLRMIRISVWTAFAVFLVYVLLTKPSLTEHIINMLRIDTVSFDPAALLGSVLFFLIICPFIIMIGYVLPERIGRSKPEKIMKMTASWIKAITTAFYIPYKIIMIFSDMVVTILGIRESFEARATEEDVRAVIQEGFEDGEIEETEQDLVERVFSLDDRKISSVLTHKNDIVWLDISSTPEEVRKKIADNPYNIYPVAEERLDNIIGVVTLKDMFDKIGSDIPLKEYVKPANFLPENVNVLETLQSFKDTRFEYALITDEFGGIQGIVTLGDLLNALVGDYPIISTETGYELIKQKEDSWLVDGQYPFYDLLRQFEIQQLYNDHPYNTLSGLILDKLDTMPVSGDNFVWHGFEITVLEMDKARIDKVLIKKIKMQEESQNIDRKE